MSEIDKDQEACITAKIEAGMSREEAEQACTAAEKAKASKDKQEFAKTIEEAVAKTLEGWKEDIISEAVKAVEQVKEEMKQTTIESVVKAIKPDKPKYLTLDGLEAALRKLKLEGLVKGDIGESEIEPSTQPNPQGYGEPGTAAGDPRKRAGDDVDKLVKQFAGNAYAPKAR